MEKTIETFNENLFNGLTKPQLQVTLCLRENSRASLVDISKKTGLSISYVHFLLKGLSEQKVVRNYCELENVKLGYSIIICFLIKAKDKEPLLLKLNNSFCVNDIFRLNLGNVFFVEAFFSNMGEVYAFVENIKEETLDIKEHHVINVISKEKMLRDGKFENSDVQTPFLL